MDLLQRNNNKHVKGVISITPLAKEEPMSDELTKEMYLEVRKIMQEELDSLKVWLKDSFVTKHVYNDNWYKIRLILIVMGVLVLLNMSGQMSPMFAKLVSVL